MAKVLTVRSVEAAKAAEKRIEIPDGGLPGLYLVVQPTGAKSWAVRYRHAGKPGKATLGPYPVLGLADARERAAETLKRVGDGVSPAAAKRAQKAAAEAAAKDTIDVFAASFVARYAKPKNRSWAETERILNREVIPAWKGRTVGEITRRDVIELLDGVVDRGAATMANRVFSAVRKMFAWGVERDVIAASPCTGLRPPSSEVKRDRVLSDDELRAVWTVAEGQAYPWGPFVSLLILTGQRREEVAQAQWSEFDLARDAVWTIPPERAKNGKRHEVPLAPQAVALLSGLPKIKGEGGKARWVFTTTGDTPVSGFTLMKRRLDAAAETALNKDRDEPLPFPAWRIHDLRRTVASGMAAIGVNLPVVEKVLNHTSGSFGGVAGVYQRYDFADEKRRALCAWANRLDVLASGHPGNVLEFSGGGSAG